MVLNMDQSQRRDIDEVTNNRITLAVDSENVTVSPYVFVPTSFVGNNWFKQGDDFVKLNLAEQDNIVFTVSALCNLSEKDITNIIVSFDYDVSNVSLNFPIFSNVGFSSSSVTNYFSVENRLNRQGHIDVECSLFGLSSSVVNTAISEQGFSIGLNFNGVKSNANIKLSNVTFKFEFTDKLKSEVIAVTNRVSTTFDFYVENDEVVINFYDDGKVGTHSADDSTVALINNMIRNAISQLGLTADITLLSNGYIKLDIDLEKGDN